MDNKNEKTFADLFSSSTKDEETTTQTFSDILNGSTEEKKESSSIVTFDSIFDKIPENEETIAEEEKNFNSFEQSNTEIPKPEIEPLKEKLAEPNNNPFLSDEPQNDSSNIDFAQKVTKEEQKVDNQESESNKNNPFFETEITDKKSNDSDSLNEDKKEETPQTNNLFFQANDVSKESTKLADEPESSPKVEPNIKSTEDNKTLNNNPFINNENIFESTKVESKGIDKIEINPLFKDENKYNEEITENPFFESSTNEDNKTSLISDIKSSAEKEEKKIEESLPKSTSPFFQEEKKIEENPFFQNQINLIENQIPNTPNSNIDMTKSKHYNVKIVKKKEPLIKFILGVLSYALFIWLLLIGITLLVYVLDIKIRAAKGDYSSPTFNAYVVLTGSMLPEIQVYDVVITKKVDAKDLNEGDVITFASADSRFLGTIITHRIIKKNPKTGTEGYTFQTKGDNNNVADSALVPEDNIYGKVILKIPKLGYLQEFLASDGGWIIVILIPCLTVISYDIVKLAKGLKRKKYKNIKVQK